MSMKVKCHECGKNCASRDPDDFIFKAYVLCYACMAKVPEHIWTAFHNAIHSKGSKRYIETPNDELPPEPAPEFPITRGMPAVSDLKEFELDMVPEKGAEKGAETE